MKTTLDVTHRGVRASVVPHGSRFYTLVIGAVDAPMSVEVDCTAVGLEIVATAILEHLDDDQLRALIEGHLAGVQAEIARQRAAER